MSLRGFVFLQIIIKTLLTNSPELQGVEKMNGLESEGEFEDLHVEVITASDSRAEAMREEGIDKDESGKIVQEKLKEADISSNRTIIPDEEEEIREKMKEFISDSNVDAIITTGGTGVTSRDITVDIAQDFFEEEFSGFGELLRRRGYEEAGLLGVFTRTTAGMANQKPIFCLPGAPSSVEIAMDFIVPDIERVIEHAKM